MSPEVIDALVRLVANGRKFGVADAVVIEHLLEMGVPKEHAQDLLKEITHGLLDGAGQHLGEQGPERNSPLYLAAYAEGKRSQATRDRQSLKSSIVTLVVLVVVISLVIWFTR
jgi:hypothetical protein